MKNPKFFLTTLFAAAAMTATAYGALSTYDEATKTVDWVSGNENAFKYIDGSSWQKGTVGGDGQITWLSSTASSVTRVNDTGWLLVFDGENQVVSADIPGGQDSSDGGGLWISGTGNVVTVTAGRWAGSIVVDAGNTLNSGWSAQLKDGHIVANGTVNLSSISGQGGNLNLDGGGERTWYVGSEGSITLVNATSLSNGTIRVLGEIHLNKDLIEGAVNRVVEGVVQTRDLVLFSAGLSSGLDSFTIGSIYEKNGNTLVNKATLEELSNVGDYTVSKTASGVSVSYLTNKYVKKDLTWAGTSSDSVWEVLGTDWTDEDGVKTSFIDGDSVKFSTEGANVRVSGVVAPSAMTVTAATTFSGTEAVIKTEYANFSVAAGIVVSLGEGVTLDLGPVASSAANPGSLGQNIVGTGKIVWGNERSAHKATIDLSDNFAGTLQFSGRLRADASTGFVQSLGGAKTLILDGVDLYTADTNAVKTFDVDVEVTSATAIGKSGVNLYYNGANGSGITFTRSFSAAGKTVQIANGVVTLSGAATIGTLNQAAGTLTISGTLDLSEGRLSGKILGQGTLTKKGTGTLNITGNSNEFSGTLHVANGVVYVGNTEDQNSGADAKLTASAHGAKIIIESGASFITHLGGDGKTFNGDVYVKNGATLGNKDGHVSLAGDIHWGVIDEGVNVSNPTYSVDSVVSYTQIWGKTITFAGALHGNGVVNLGESAWEANANYVISGEDNTFAGTYSLSAGEGKSTTLKLLAATAASTASVNLSTPQTSLKLGASAVTIAGLSGSGSVILDGVSTSMLTVSGGGFAGTLADGISLTVSGGTLVAGSASALGTGSVTIDAGALLEVDVGAESTLTFNNTVTLSDPSATEAAISLKSGKLAFGSDFRLNLEGTAESLNGQTVKVLAYSGGALDDSVANVNLHDFITYNDIALSVRVTVDATNFLTDGTLSFAGGAYDLVWGGASSGTWDYVSEELWKKDSASGNAEKFVEGDNASFATDGDIAVTIAEGGVKAGVASFDAGTVTLSGGKLVASRIDINNGATLKLGAVGVIDGAVAVKSGGTFDLNGKSANFGSNGGRVTLSGGTLTNTGGNVSAGEQQLYGLDLTADSFIAGTGNFGIVYAGNAETELNLNGFTLTKSGTNTLSFSKTTLKNGTLAVTEGTVNVTVGGPAFKLGENAHLNVSGTGVANLTITSMAKGSSLTLGGTGASSVTLSGEQKIKGNITIGSGSTVTMAENDVFSWSDSSISQKVLLDGGTLAMGGTRQSFESWVDLEFNGGTLTGSGDAYGAVDLVQAKTIKVTGNTDFEATLRIRGDATFDVAEGVTLDLSGVVDPNGDVSKSGVGGALVKSGKGTMLVSGNNEKYNNETRITGGRLIAASSKALGTAGVSVSSGAVLEFRNADAEGTAFDSEFSAVVAGEGSVEKSGAGTLTLSGVNTFSGGVTLSEGKLIATVEGALGAGDITLDAGTTLETATASLGSGKITIAGAGISLNATSALTADGLTFTFGADAGSVALSNFTFTNATVDLSALTIDSDYTIFTGYSGSEGISVTGVDTSTGRLIIRSSGNVVWRVGDYLDLTWTNDSGSSVWDYTSDNWGGDADVYTNGNVLKFAVENAEIKVNGSDFSAKSIEIEANTTFKQYDDNAYAITTETLDVVAGKTLTLADKGTLKITGSLGANGTLAVGENATLAFSNTATSVSGTLSGNGRVEMASSSISVGNTFRDSAGWTGTVAFVNDVTAEDWAISAYGNANSTIEIKNFSGFFDEGENKEIASNLKIAGTVTIKDGWSNQTLTFSGDVSGNKFEFTKGNTQKFLFGGNVDLVSMSFNKGVVGFDGDSTDIDELSLTNSASATFSGTAVALGNVTTASGTTLSVVGDGNSLVSIEKLSSSGALNVSGVTLTLSGTSNLYGTTTITNGALLDLTSNASTGVWDDGYRGDGVFVIDGATLKMSDLRWGAPGNFGANMTNDRILLKNGGILEVTAAQASDAGAQRGFSVTEGTGTYRYSGTGTSYVAANDIAQSVHLANDAVLVWDVVEAGANLTVSKVIGLGQNASAMSATSGTVEKTGLGTLTLSGANLYTGGTTISGGKLVATNAAALGTGAVTNNASLELNFDGEMSNAVSGSGILTVSGGNVELSGANTYSGGTTVSGGKLVATNASALGTGPVTNNASLELNFDGEMSNVVSGSGVLTVSGGNVELSGANTYSGGTTVSGGKLVMTNASALGTGPVTNNASLELNYDGAFVSEVSGNGMLSVAIGKTVSADSSKLGSFTGETNVGGTLNLNADSDGALKVTGSGLLNKIGSGVLTLESGSTVANINLTAGALKNVALGSNMALTIAGTGTTLDALAMSDGTLDVSAAAVTLGGTTELSGGTIKLGAANATSVAFNVTGTTTITNGVTFNFATLETPTTTDVTVTYQVFSGGTLVGWNADTLSKSNFEIGDGAALSDRASLTFNTDGSVTIANKVYTLEWSGDGNSTWAVGSTTWTNKTDANANDTAYMNSDKVIFASDASVTLGSAVAPVTLEVNAGVKLTLTGDANNKITGAGTVSIGEGASLILNSGHDYTGVTTLADGASLQLNLSGDSVALKSNLVLEDSAKGTLIVNTASDCSLDDKFTGSLGDGAWTFKKEGEGILSVSGKLSTLIGDDKVRVAAGTLKLMSVGAIGSAQAEIESGATLEVASATDANFAVEISGDGNFRKSGGGKLTLASANESFVGNAQVAEGILRLENASALGAGFKNTSIELGANTALEIAFGGSFGKTFKGKGTVDAVSWERLILSGDSSEFTGTFKVNDIAVAKQASSFGNGILQVDEKALVAFELTPTAGNSIENEFGGVLAGAGSVSVETGVGVEMIFSGDNASDKFSGKLELKDRSTLVAYRGDVFGTSGDVDVLLGDRAVLQVGSGANSVLAAQLSGAGALTKIGSGTLTLENPDNDFTGMIRVEDGTLKASPAALGKSTQVSLDSDDATLHLLTDSGKTATLTKFVRGSGNVAVSGGGKLLWKNSEKRFSGNLTVSEKTTLNTDEFVDVESGHVVLENGAVWEATQGFAVRGDSSIVIASAQNTIPVSAMQLRASQTLVSGTQLNVGSFVAAANKSGEVLIEDITVTPTNGGNGALIAFELDSVRDAAKPRITLTHDASVVLDNVAVEVTLDESIRDAWDVPEIKFVWRDGTAADISGEIESVTVIMADGSEVKYLYDARSGSLSLSPISPEMNLAYAAMVAMPTETFSQDVQSLHRRMEQRRFEAATSKDEWQFFAQAQSMSIENGDDRADSATFDFSTYGTLVGGDVRLNASTVFGMALAYDHGTADIHDNQGEITMDSYRATIYAGTVIGDYCFAEGGAHFGFGSYEIERRGSYGDNKGDTDGWSAGAFVNAGRLIPTAVEDLYLTPYVGLAYLHSSVEEIEETGTRSMKTDGFDADSLRARVGIGASYAFELGETPTRFGLDLAYSHEFLDDEVETDVVASGVDYARTLKEKVGAEDAISVGASFDFSLSKNTGLFLNYTVDFGTNSDTAHRGNIGFRFTY